MSVRPFLLTALALAAPDALFDSRVQAQDQVADPFIIEGDQVEQIEGSIDAAEVIIRDNGRLELVGGFADLEGRNDFPQVLLEDEATAQVVFGEGDQRPVITTTGRSQLDIVGGSAILQPEGSSQIRVTDGLVTGSGSSIAIGESSTLTAIRTRVGGEEINVLDSATLIIIDSGVVPFTATDSARVELFGGRDVGTATFGGNFFLDQSSALVDGFTTSSGPGDANFTFADEATGVFRGETQIIDNIFITVREDAEVRIEGGRYVAAVDPFDGRPLGAFNVSGNLTFTGGTIEYLDGVPGASRSLFSGTDDAVITFEGGQFTDAPEVLDRFAAAASDPATVFPGLPVGLLRSGGDLFEAAEFQNPAIALFDQSQLVLLSDEININGDVFGLGDAESLTLTDLPEFGVLSAVLADGNPFEASFVRDLGTTITLRAADPGTPNPVPTPTALGGGLVLLGLGLRRRR